MSVTYVWASEETGFRHLYLVTSSLHLNHVNGCQTDATAAAAAAAAASQQPNFVEPAALQARIVNKVALTSGEWEVLARNLWVDKANQLVYFLGLRDTPLEKHLYVVSLQRPEHIRLLTEPGYSYLVEFDDVSETRNVFEAKIHTILITFIIAMSTYAASLLQYSTPTQL